MFWYYRGMRHEGQDVYGVVYKLTSPSGKVYVGQTTDFDKRMAAYRGGRCRGQAYLYAAILKHGWDNFRIEVIDTAEFKEHLDFYETLWIEMLGAMDPARGYNLKSGGANGRPNAATRAKIGAGNKGKVRSAELRARLSRAHTGKKQSAETIAKRAAAITGLKISPETRTKITGERHHHARAVICITTGERYGATAEAARAVSADGPSISACCRGKRNYAGKLPDGTPLQWRYA